eukprot:1158821-Pelagomonas_calceolata.AAC.1
MASLTVTALKGAPLPGGWGTAVYATPPGHADDKVWAWQCKPCRQRPQSKGASALAVSAPESTIQ